MDIFSLYFWCSLKGRQRNGVHHMAWLPEWISSVSIIHRHVRYPSWMGKTFKWRWRQKAAYDSREENVNMLCLAFLSPGILEELLNFLVSTGLDKCVQMLLLLWTQQLQNLLVQELKWNDRLHDEHMLEPLVFQSLDTFFARAKDLVATWDWEWVEDIAGADTTIPSWKQIWGIKR